MTAENSSKISVRPYTDESLHLWDNFVDKSLNGTIFHKRAFLAYHPKERFKDSSLMFFLKNKLVGVFPAALIEKDGCTTLKSHPGASYGGIVVGSSPGIKLANDIVAEILEFAKAQKIGRIETRIAEKIFNSYPCDEIDFAMNHNGFKVKDIELSTCYQITEKIQYSSSENSIILTFDSSCQRATRKALSFEPDLRAEICHSKKDFSDYWDILANNLKKHNTKPTHSKEELLDLKARLDKEIQLVGVFYKNQIIAGITAFVINKRAAHVFYFASMYEHQDKRPLNLAMVRLIQFAAKNNLNFINFGISTENGGSVINWGLFRFKESFGGCGIERKYWVKDLNLE